MAHATWRVRTWCSQRPSCVMVPLPPNSNISEKKKLHFPIVSILQSKLGNKLTFMLCPHLIPYLCRAKIVHWVSESKWPFQIVKDRGFQNLMKTGRPEYHIPSVETVSHDARNVFVNVHKYITKMLQVSNARHLISLKKTHFWCRNIMALSALLPMHGPLQITKPMLL